MKKPSKSSRRASAEPLESRTLLSLTWSTDYSNTDAKTIIRGMAADKAGDVYAVGQASPNNTPVVRERTPDGTWTTLATLALDDTGGTAGAVYGVAIDSAGEVFVAARAYGTDGADYARIFEQPAGQTGVFKVIDNFRLGTGNPYAIATDAAGDVYATEVAYIKIKPSQYSYAGEIRKLVPDAASATGFTGSTVYTNTDRARQIQGSRDRADRAGGGDMPGRATERGLDARHEPRVADGQILLESGVVEDVDRLGALHVAEQAAAMN